MESGNSVRLLSTSKNKHFPLQPDEKPEYYSPEDLAEIAEGFAQIRRGETVSWEELKKELGL
jgi:hypothetical protein